MNKSETKYQTIKVPNVTYKSVLTKYRNIKKRNEVFNNLDNETKRREIAFDALKLLLAETIVPAGGIVNGERLLRSYMDITLCNMIDYSSTSSELQEKFTTLKPKQQCVVCARGGLMLSQIRLGNSLCISEKIDKDDIIMGEIWTIKGFTKSTFQLIEDVYEYSNIPYHARTVESLMNIFCNIIINGDYIYVNTIDRVDYLKDKKVKIQ